MHFKLWKRLRRGLRTIRRPQPPDVLTLPIGHWAEIYSDPASVETVSAELPASEVQIVRLDRRYFLKLPLQRAAEPFIEDINLAMARQSRYRPLEFADALFERQQTGVSTTVIIRPAQMTITGGSFRAVVGGQSTPQRSAAERSLALMAREADFREAWRIANETSPDFRKLYVAYEKIKCRWCSHPDKWRELVACGWATERELESFRETANEIHRHGKPPRQLKWPQMSTGDAADLIMRLLDRWLDAAEP